MSDTEWMYPTAQELAGKTIRIENTGLQPIYMTMPTDGSTGKGLSNIKRIEIDINIDGKEPHITAKVTLHDHSASHRLREWVAEEVTLDNPLLLIDAEVTEIKMSWPAK